MRVRLLHLFGVEQALGGTETRSSECSIDRLLALTTRPVSVSLLLAGVEVNAWNQLQADLLAVLGNVEDLRKVTGILAALDAYPAADRDLRLLFLQLEQVCHLQNGDKERLGV